MAEHTALVTGGNRGIGLEACRELAQSGHTVILTARDAKAGEAAAEELRGDGLDVTFEQMDVADEKSVAACAARLKGDGIHIDVLINNAGVYPHGALPALATETLRAAMDTNFMGAFFCCRAFTPAM